MSNRQESGVAGDSADYEDFPEPQDGPRPRPRVSEPAGISEDAALYEDLVEQPRDDTLDLDSTWNYKVGDEVFGPVTSKLLVEKLYDEEINEETLIASPDDGEFMALRRYGVFLPHVAKLPAHRAARQDARKKERQAKNQRLRRKFLFISMLGLLGAAGFGSMWWYVQTQRAEKIAREKEDRIRQEMDDMLASVTIEPPLIDLVQQEAPPKAGPRKGRGGRRIKPAANLPPGAELTREEIMDGVSAVFGDIKRCIVQQMQRDRDGLPSRIVLSFNIQNTGKVRDVSIDDRILRTSPMQACMAQKLGTLQFRHFKGEVRNIEYPISIGKPG